MTTAVAPSMETFTLVQSMTPMKPACMPWHQNESCPWETFAPGLLGLAQLLEELRPVRENAGPDAVEGLHRQPARIGRVFSISGGTITDGRATEARRRRAESFKNRRAAER